MRKTLFGTGLACAALLVGTVPAMAVPAATTYHGTWFEAKDCGALEDLDTGSDVRPMTGKWRVILQPDGTAVVSIVVFDAKGVLHTAWGGRALMGLDFNITSADAETFEVTQAGGRLSLALDSAGELVFTIRDFDCDRTDPTDIPITAELYGTLLR